MIPMFSNRKNEDEKIQNKVYFVGNRVGPASYYGYYFKFPAMPLLQNYPKSKSASGVKSQPGKFQIFELSRQFLLGEKMAPKEN
jgi:hypothetical protein